MTRLKFINKEFILELMENKDKFKLVDALTEDDFAKGHLPNALNIPVTRMEELFSELLPDKGELIITYCSDYLCSASTGLARFLQDKGYENVVDYKGGQKDWMDAGLPLMK